MNVTSEELKKQAELGASKEYWASGRAEMVLRDKELFHRQDRELRRVVVWLRRASLCLIQKHRGACYLSSPLEGGGHPLAP